MDTIVAISSGHINQAISIIRIVGPDSLEIIKKIFTGKLGQNRTIQYGFIKDGDNILDEVLVSFFIGTDNFVGEDTIEINAHGGIVVTQKILELVISHGARMAYRGEFSKRAFLNGKISLLKAEAINDLINAKTSKQQSIAINSFNQSKERRILDFIKDVEYLIGLCEINIDYPEYDDIPILENHSFVNKIDDLIVNLERIVNQSMSSQIYQKPIIVSIVGKPNVGKSSLLNTILNDEKAIVTNIPGTTRDIIESEVIFNNLILKFKDTAGIREASDEIEKIGINKSWNELVSSDIIIHLIDATKTIDQFDEQILEKARGKKYLQIWNKSDLIKSFDKNKIYISTKMKDIKNLELALENILSLNDLEKENDIFNERQTACLKKALNYFKSAQEGIKSKMTYDVVIIDLHQAWESLKEILGDVNKEELLDSIFKNFCLGK